MSEITKILAAGIITVTLAAIVTAAPVAQVNDDNITITDNIREAVSILDVQLALVIDKHNHMHVLTVSDIKTPAESAPENVEEDDLMDKSVNKSAVVGKAGGKFSTQIRQEADGCWWLTRGERNQDGTLIEADEVCIGGRGCPVGERKPVAQVHSSLRPVSLIIHT
jgi:hypothetical protein